MKFFTIIILLNLLNLGCYQVKQTHISPEKFAELYLGERRYADHWSFAGKQDGKFLLERWKLLPHGSTLRREETVYCLEKELDHSLFSTKQEEVDYGHRHYDEETGKWNSEQ